jgi:predicted TIM-barrel fold metal-dependent hydrolase
MRIVDTHQHLWDLEWLPYTWAHHRPALHRSFRLSDYLRAAANVELEQSVHVEADVDEPYILQETRMILALAEQDNPIQGVVAGGRPEKEGFRAYLDLIAGHPKLKGIRRILHTEPDGVGKSPLFARNVALLADYGLSFDLCVLARQLPVAIWLAEQCPGVSFVLDHCGFPLIREKLMDPWRGFIRTLARFPNVVACKVSGVLANVDPEHWSLEELRPYFDHLVECFGWDRLIFGSDWPVCTLATTFQGWVDTISFLTQARTESERYRLFRDNAVRVYKLNITSEVVAQIRNPVILSGAKNLGISRHSRT